MDRLLRGAVWSLVGAAAGLAAAPRNASADALSAVQVLREGGCGGVVPRARALLHDVLLDRLAERWALGATLSSAAAGTGLPSQSIGGVHIRGPESADIPLLRSSSCRQVTDQNLRAMGAYRVGQQTWIVLYPVRASSQLQAQIQTTPAVQPRAPVSPAAATQARTRPHASLPAVKAAPATAVLAPRALELINEVRSRGARCGDRSFAPVRPVTFSATLTEVASAHALDMAEHNYFEHVDLAGRSPADRVRSVGYQEKLVGENIAYGPVTVDEVVQGWLDSPGHCENIMDPRFVQMGIAVAAGRSTRRGLYWVQVLAEPRA
jgi:uncharacterized protein YkwD